MRNTRTRSRTRNGGFTLVEAAVVAAVMGLLAVIAIPNFLRFQLKTKAAEARVNLSSIRTAELGYFAENGSYVATAIVPGLLPGERPQSRPTAPTAFDTLGWSPDGDVYFVYAVSVSGVAFTAEAVADIDGDGVTADFAYIQPGPGATVGVAPILASCSPNGVFSHGTGTQDALAVVGPCEAADGRSQF